MAVGRDVDADTAIRRSRDARKAEAKSFVLERIHDAEMLGCAVAGWSPWHRSRVAALRAMGATIDRSAVIYHGFMARAVRHLTIGPRSIIGERAILDARGGLLIGADVNFSNAVSVWTAQHDWQAPEFDYVKSGVTIEDRAWLGPRVIVLPGSVIREGAVVAAGAVVSGELEGYGLYGGVPARRIADRTTELTYHLPGSRHKTWIW